MVLQKYNRNLEKEIIKNSINFHFNELIENELEKEGWNEAIEAYHEAKEKRLEKKFEFVRDYLEKNKPLECINCFYPGCYLRMNDECGEIGIKIEEVSFEKETSIYEVKEISKYSWVNVGDCLIPVLKGHEEEFLKELR
jgi:hypothetical protein